MKTATKKEMKMRKNFMSRHYKLWLDSQAPGCENRVDEIDRFFRVFLNVEKSFTKLSILYGLF